MDSRKIVFHETAIVAAGEILCSAIMVGVFFALGHRHLYIIWSALAGCATFASEIIHSLYPERKHTL